MHQRYKCIEKCIACRAATPNAARNRRGSKWIMNAISGPRYSVAVDATSQRSGARISSLLLSGFLFFFFYYYSQCILRVASSRAPSGSDGKAACNPFGANYARSIGDETHPLQATSFFSFLSLSLPFLFLVTRFYSAASIFRPFPHPFYYLFLPSRFPALACLPRFRTYLRDKRLFIAVHRAARVIKSAARGV